MCKQICQWIKTRSINLQAALLTTGVLALFLGLEHFGLLPYLNLTLGWLVILGYIASALVFIVAIILRLSAR